MHKGVGLTRLRKNFWEVRKGIKARILFRWDTSISTILAFRKSEAAPSFLSARFRGTRGL
jgi:hypothetical protein